jgi:hypothetical protein
MWVQAVQRVSMRLRIARLNATERPRTIDLPNAVTRLHTDGSEWRRALDGKPYMVRFPTNYDTPELRATLRQRAPAAAAGWAHFGVNSKEL